MHRGTFALAAIAREWFQYDAAIAELFFFSVIAAIVAIIWKPGFTYALHIFNQYMRLLCCF